MNAYFDDFKEKMQNRFRIPKTLVGDREKDFFFWLTMIKPISK